MKNYLIILTAIIFVSCAENKADKIQYQDRNQILNVNNTNRYGETIEPAYMKTISPDTVKIGEKINFKVFLSQPNFKIVDARFDCDVSNISLVDTINDRIIGCAKGLLIENDTVRIQFKVGGNLGKRSFPEIVILSKDNDNIYRYHKGTFSYFVNK